MDDQEEERLVLPITGIVLGGLGAILAFISGLRLLGLALSIIGLIVIVVSFAVNQKHKKVLTYVGLALTIIAAVLATVLEGNEPTEGSNATHLVSKALNAEDESIREKKRSDNAKMEAVDKAMTEEVIEKNAKVNINNDASAWTKDYYDKLQVSDEITGIGGAKLADIEAVVGKPSLESDVDADLLKVRVTSWSNPDDTKQYVLIFVKQDNGDWLLVDKSITSDNDTV